MRERGSHELARIIPVNEGARMRAGMRAGKVVLLVVACGVWSGCKKKVEDAPPATAPSVSARVEQPRPSSMLAEKPEPEPAARSTGVPECDEYLATFDSLRASCKQELGGAMDAMQESINAQRQAFASWSTLDEASRGAARKAAAPGCKAATDALKQIATSFSCALATPGPSD